MKRYLFIYREDRVSYCDPYYGYTNRTELIEKEFPAGSNDWEIMEEARAHEVMDLIEGRNTASEGCLNRVLMRVIQIAREVPV
jgi:hypothetical protein